MNEVYRLLKLRFQYQVRDPGNRSSAIECTWHAMFGSVAELLFLATSCLETWKKAKGSNYMYEVQKRCEANPWQGLSLQADSTLFNSLKTIVSEVLLWTSDPNRRDQLDPELCCT